MKICPHCTKTFSDEYNFCLGDGTTLIVETDPENTIPFKISSEQIPKQNNFPSNEVPTNIIPPAPITREIITKNSSKWLFLIIGILATALAATGFFIFNKTDINSATVSGNKTLSPDGNWAGDWNTEKTSYSAVAKFNEQNGEVSGQIVWTLKQTTNPKKIDKVGTSAVEYVQGNYNPQTKMLKLHGVRKEDPNSIVILDKYTLSLSEDNQMLMGNSINGKFVLRR